jgi:hypothetical protein
VIYMIFQFKTGPLSFKIHTQAVNLKLIILIFHPLEQIAFHPRSPNVLQEFQALL